MLTTPIKVKLKVNNYKHNKSKSGNETAQESSANALPRRNEHTTGITSLSSQIAM